MFASLRAWQLTGALLTLTLACGNEPSMTDAMANADKKEKADKKAAEEADKKLAEQAKKAKEGVLEHPWTFDGLKVTLKIGTILDYEMTGTDAKGEAVEDRLHAEVAGHDELDVKILEYKDSQKDIPAVTQPQGHPWGKLSPFFWVEQSKTKLERAETIEVPAGKFDCVVADISGYFGNHLTVWMIADQPGIYAQVVQHVNTKNAEEGDQTEITYRLASIKHEE